MTKICPQEIETKAQKTEIDHSDVLQHGGGRVFGKKGVKTQVVVQESLHFRKQATSTLFLVSDGLQMAPKSVSKND